MFCFVDPEIVPNGDIFSKQEWVRIYSSLLREIVTVRKRSCGKVMFSQACVKNSVHNGGVYPSMHWGRHPLADTPHPPAGTPPSRYTLLAGTPLGRYIPLAGTPLGQVHPLEQVHPPGRYALSNDSHCSGRYASYWNAFLFSNTFT